MKYIDSFAHGLAPVARWTSVVVAGGLLAFGPLLQSGVTGQAPPETPANQDYGQAAPTAAMANQGFPGGRVGMPPTADDGTSETPQVSRDLMGFSRATADGGQRITLIHTSRSWMAVYHVDGTGKIRLESSRPLKQDFAVEFNAVDPRPEAMRQMTKR